MAESGIFTASKEGKSHLKMDAVSKPECSYRYVYTCRMSIRCACIQWRVYMYEQINSRFKKKEERAHGIMGRVGP